MKSVKSALELEAEQLAAELLKKDNPPEGVDPAASAGEAQPGSPSQDPPHQEQAGGPGEPEPEVVKNPALMIAGALRRARDLPKVSAVVPVAVLLVFDDETINQLAYALGAVLVKYEVSAPSWLDRYKEEIALVWVCFGIYLALSEALAAAQPINADPRAGGERDVTPPRGDPPPHVDGVAQPV